MVGEFADTALFCFIAFAGVFPTWGSLISFTVTGYLYKVLVEVILLPVTFAVIKMIKRREPGYAAPPGARRRFANCGWWWPLRITTMRSASTATSWDSPRRSNTTPPGGAKVMILNAGRATLELSNPAQIDYIDTVETGRTGVSGQYRVAFEVDDCAAVTERLAAAGAEVIAPPTRTPWDSMNARLTGPANNAADGVH